MPDGITPGFDTNPGASFLAEQGRYDRIAGALTAQARGVEFVLIAQARARGISTGVEHLATMDIDPDDTRAIGGAGSAAPVEWVSGERRAVKLSENLKATVSDPARRISVIHNHPDSSGFSIKDLEMLEFSPGLVRVTVVGHDDSLYRAAHPHRRRGGEYGHGCANHEKARRTRRVHRAGPGGLPYAHAIAGGSRVNLMRFGEERFERIITELLKWPGLRHGKNWKGTG